MTTPAEGVREIQLSGKQLVFLFMAVTVVSVVISSAACWSDVACRRSTLVDAPVMVESAPPDDAGAPPALAADAPTPRAEVSFPERLGDNATPKEKLVAAKEPPPPAAAAVPASTPAFHRLRRPSRRRPAGGPRRRRAGGGRPRPGGQGRRRAAHSRHPDRTEGFGLRHSGGRLQRP